MNRTAKPRARRPGQPRGCRSANGYRSANSYRSAKWPVAALGVLFSSALSAEPAAPPDRPEPLGSLRTLQIWVDDDDDDGNGQADRVDSALPQGIGDERLSVVALPAEVRNPAVARLWRDGKPHPPSVSIRAAPRKEGPGVMLQGLAPGSAKIILGGGVARLDVFQAFRVEPQAWSTPPHASISRELPVAVSTDPERFRLGVRGPSGRLPKSVWLRSYSATGRALDSLGPIKLESVACPAAQADDQLACAQTGLLRVVGSAVDRSHPAAGQALRAEFDGVVELSAQRAVARDVGVAKLRLLGPDLGPTVPRRGKLRLRVHVVRQSTKGAPAVGGSNAGAELVVRRELADAGALWAQCGLELSVESFAVVDPPVPSMLAVGCEQGAVSGAGSVRVLVDGRELRVAWAAGLTPLEVAVRIRAAIEKLGFVARLSPNSKNAFAALPSVDVLVQRKDGKAALLAPPPSQDKLSAADVQPVSTDASLSVCLGEVSLTDGLNHFYDFNSGSGTLEERSLLKSLEDDDPASIELVVIPSFARSGRIGESFIYTDGSSLRNALIVDRAGIRAGSRSFVLAHELGHILLDAPGHPDDFGVDDPSLLMDSDASDASSFGPRRLSLAECRRMWVQSAGGALLPLITAVPTGLPAPGGALSEPASVRRP